MSDSYWKGFSDGTGSNYSTSQPKDSWERAAYIRGLQKAQEDKARSAKEAADAAAKRNAEMEDYWKKISSSQSAYSANHHSSYRPYSDSAYQNSTKDWDQFKEYHYESDAERGLNLPLWLGLLIICALTYIFFGL